MGFPWRQKLSLATYVGRNMHMQGKAELKIYFVFRKAEGVCPSPWGCDNCMLFYPSLSYGVVAFLQAMPLLAAARLASEAVWTRPTTGKRDRREEVKRQSRK